MKKLKVILVDDEDLVIDDMRTLIDWESNGFQIVGTAYNGLQASKLIPQVQPDIVFMDVSLPDTDGITLSRQMRSRFPDMVIIILSSYMNFSYAQGAVEISALSYLVKHQMTPERLLEVLSSARNTIEKKQLSNLLISRLLLRDILDHNPPISPSTMDSLSVYQDSFLLLLFSPVIPYCHKEDTVSIRHPRISSLQNISNPFLFVQDVLIYQSDLLVFLTMKPDARAGNRYKSSLELIVHKIQEQLKTQTGLVFFSLYLNCESTLSTLQENYRCLFSHREYYRFYPDKNFLCIEQQQALSPSLPEMCFISQDTFFNAQSSFMNALSECLQQLINEKNMEGFTECCESVRKLLDDFPDSAEISMDLDCCYASDIAEALLAKCRSFYQHYQQKKQYAPSTNYILQYIYDHYNQNPSLAEVAAQLNSNSMYMGQKFKKDTGKTFHSYLNEYRIEIAKKLLSTTNLRIFEISDQVGLGNSQYFSKIFKEFTDVTPNEYRLEHYKL